MAKCVLNPNKQCDDCGECKRCDLDSTKICDNCCKCLELPEDDYIKVPLEQLYYDKSDYELAPDEEIVGENPLEVDPEMLSEWEKRLNEYDDAQKAPFIRRPKRRPHDN